MQQHVIPRKTLSSNLRTDFAMLSVAQWIVFFVWEKYDLKRIHESKIIRNLDLPAVWSCEFVLWRQATQNVQEVAYLNLFAPSFDIKASSCQKWGLNV